MPSSACAAPLNSRRRDHAKRGAAAARPAHRARQRPRFQLHLSASHRCLAARRRRNPAVLAARRRAAAGRRRLLLAAGRLSGTACRSARGARTICSTDCAVSPQTRPVHGECGGYMVLGESLEDAAGRRHAMTGLLGHATSFAQRKLHLGYRSARLLSDGALGARRRDRARPRIPLRARSPPPGTTSRSPNRRQRRPRAGNSRRPARPRQRHVFSRYRRAEMKINTPATPPCRDRRRSRC